MFSIDEVSTFKFKPYFCASICCVHTKVKKSHLKISCLMDFFKSSFTILKFFFEKIISERKFVNWIYGGSLKITSIYKV